MAYIANHQTGPTRRLTLALGLASITACRPVNLRATLAAILPPGLDPAQLGAELHATAPIPLADCLQRAGLANRATLADQIAEDFATGRVVTLAGWQLAHTEAWLCAAIHAQSS